MEIFRGIKSMREFRKSLNGELGFVPTMGALHEGHLSLINKSVRENSHTIVSIFVNPAQFGANEDFSRYPRDEQKDLALCAKSGASAVFLPSASEMYPNEIETLISAPSDMASVFEGEIRSGHFDGVLRVLIKFFHILSPTRAYFGQKDAQQLLIVRRMVRDLFLDLQIVGVPIVRDKNGLALSSRNVYLNKDSYNCALGLNHALVSVKEQYSRGERDCGVLKSIAMCELKNVDYCEVVDLNLKKLSSVIPNGSLMLLAARFGGVRLLDNLWF